MSSRDIAEILKSKSLVKQLKEDLGLTTDDEVETSLTALADLERMEQVRASRSILCEEAMARFKLAQEQATEWHNWSIRWAYIAAIIVIIGIALVFLRQLEIGVVTTLIGALGGGALVTYTNQKHKEAREESRKAWEEVEEHCKP